MQEVGAWDQSHSGASSKTEIWVMRLPRTVAVSVWVAPVRGHRSARLRSGASAATGSASGAASGHSPTALAASLRVRRGVAKVAVHEATRGESAAPHRTRISTPRAANMSQISSPTRLRLPGEPSLSDSSASVRSIRQAQVAGSVASLSTLHHVAHTGVGEELTHLLFHVLPPAVSPAGFDVGALGTSQNAPLTVRDGAERLYDRGEGDL